jgi:hypothetical protein
MFRSLSDLAVSGADQLLANPEVISLSSPRPRCGGQTLYFCVADPGCLSWILILFHPGSYIQQQQKRGEGKNCCLTFFCSLNFTKFKTGLYFCTGIEKNLRQLTKNVANFNPKSFTKLSEIALGNQETYPGSGSRGQKSNQFGICHTTLFELRLVFVHIYSGIDAVGIFWNILQRTDAYFLAYFVEHCKFLIVKNL